MEPQTILALILIYGGAGAIQGMVGFGFAILSVPLVAILYGPGAAVAMNVVVGTALLAYKAWLQRGHLDRRAVFSFGAATLLFIPAGVLLISVLPEEPALAVIGLFVVMVALGNLVSRHHVHRAAATPLAFWGLAGMSGMLAGAFSAPGPSAVPYFTARAAHPLTAQANLQLYFLVLGVPVILSHAIAGNFTGAALSRAVWFIPVVFAATWAGTRVAVLLPAERLRRVVDGALLALGIWLVIDNTHLITRIVERTHT